VKPEDVRYALERSFKLGSTAGYYQTIVGASKCFKAPKKCDLRRGIEVDNVSNTIAFHLTRPDPDFLYKLALLPAVAVPAGTPIRDLGVHPPPSTGPYMVTDGRKKGFRLVPNPYFREWSPAAKPAGYVHEFIFKVPPSLSAGLQAVEQGRADLVDATHPGTISPKTLAEIRTHYASRIYFRPLLGTIFLFLNTHVAPFDNVRARQAVNYAIDRRHIAQIFGPASVSVTCQVLPPGFLGYRRSCPYTRDPNHQGIWTAPDPEKARRLVAASGTRGMKVTIWEVRDYGGRKIARYIASVLEDLGYRTEVRLKDDLDSFAAFVSNSRNKAQIAGWGWGADYPAPSTFFGALLSCKSFVPNSASNQNQSEFCNPRIDAEMEKALERQLTDPGTAGALWARIDRQVVRKAPWVPLFNLRRFNLVSQRVGNFQFHPVWFALFDQMWVR
jgi:peptide/nickel transport system substrate-binding protein